jgi:uncharacterized integral membrane protein
VPSARRAFCLASAGSVILDGMAGRTARRGRSRVRIPGTHLEGGRAIAVGALALYILLFIVLNNRRLEVNFVFFKVKSHELLALIVIVLLGFLAG